MKNNPGQLIKRARQHYSNPYGLNATEYATHFIANLSIRLNIKLITHVMHPGYEEYLTNTRKNYLNQSIIINRIAIK